MRRKAAAGIGPRLRVGTGGGRAGLTGLNHLSLETPDGSENGSGQAFQGKGTVQAQVEGKGAK